MSRSCTGLFLGLLASIALVGCTPSTPSIPDTPDGTVSTVAKELAAGKPQVVWAALPESYQKDVTDLVHTFAEKMDAELYDKSMSVLKKAVGVLKTKQAMIIEMITGEGAPPGLELKKEDLENAWGQTVGVLEAVLNSEVGSLAKLKTVDVGSFLASTGAKVMAQAQKLSKTSKEDPYTKEFQAKLSKIEVTVEESADDTAKVKVTIPDESPETIDLVKVEGRWVPEEMAEEWSEAMVEAKKNLDENMKPETFQQMKPQMLMMLSAVDTGLDQLAKAETKEEFMAALQGLMQNAPIPGMGRRPSAPPGF